MAKSNLPKDEYEYPQSIQPPEPPTFADLESELMKGRLLLHARFPLIVKRERLHKWFGMKDGKATRVFDPRVALVIVSVQQSSARLEILGDEVPKGETVSQLRTYIEITPTEGDIAFFNEYRKTIEGQAAVIEYRQALDLARERYVTELQKLDELCKSDTTLIEVPQGKGLHLNCTYAQLEGLIADDTRLNRGTKNRLIQKRLKLLHGRRAALALANGISIRTAKAAVEDAEAELGDAINKYWTLTYLDEIADALKEAFADMEVLGPGLEADGMLKRLARAVTLNSGNVFNLDLKGMTMRRPKSPPVAHSLYFALDVLKSSMMDENHNVVVRKGPQFAFAPYAKGVTKGPGSTYFELIGPIVVGCETSDGGVYAVRLCPEIWRAILMNAERLRVNGTIDRLVEDWEPVVVSAESGKLMEAEIAEQVQAARASAEPESEQPAETPSEPEEPAYVESDAPSRERTVEEVSAEPPASDRAPAPDDDDDVVVIVTQEKKGDGGPLAETEGSGASAPLS